MATFLADNQPMLLPLCICIYLLAFQSNIPIVRMFLPNVTRSVLSHSTAWGWLFAKKMLGSHSFSMFFARREDTERSAPRPCSMP